MTLDLAADRAEFCQHAEKFWMIKTAKRANLEIYANDEIVDRWVSQKRLGELLLPLLHNQSDAIRHAAAGYLLEMGFPDDAIPIIRALASSSVGGIAPMAKVVLMKKGIPL